ncbi:MAG: DNA mismatch repair endonuclease MutL [Firmicutes bacterium]|nr:DNA mismatch repair endonuclease MutL [Bacillota bacterium]
MGKIVVLDREVSEKIAAGEVIERPASIVKELVENSLDAGSSKIEIEIKSGGHQLISVADDGTGMSREDALLALERFATSKIKEVEDLEKITTLGFRGEAIPSIFAVSRIEIITREKDSSTGVRIKGEGGKVLEVQEVSNQPGTRITVTGIFYNTPARKKFMKSAAAETGFIIDLIGRMALGSPSVHFKVINNGKVVLNLPPAMPLSGKAAEVLGLKSSDDLLQISNFMAGINLEGFIAKPDLTKGNRTSQIIFLNSRLIKSPYISQAVQEGYHPLLTEGRFPLFVLFLKIDPAMVDVNVHPTKSEVRFSRARDIFRCVETGIKKALTEARITIDPEGKALYEFEKQGLAVEEEELILDLLAKGYNQEPSQYAPIHGESFAAAESSHFETFRAIAEENANYKIAGRMIPLARIKDTYILASDGKEILIIDQHTAHERINYEKLKKNVASGGKSQGLLVPAVIEANRLQAEIIKENIDFLKSLGFDIEVFGEKDFLLRSIPSIAIRRDASKLIKDIVSEIEEEKESSALHDMREKLIKSVACRSSIMSGEKIKKEEVDSILESLKDIENSSFCPHGRPAVIRLNVKDLDRLFRRNS